MEKFNPKSEPKTDISSQAKSEVKLLFSVAPIVTYIASESKPDENYYFFAYKIKISNLGKTAAQLMGRHWVIIDGSGNVEEVRGAGVVGNQPRIMPGQSYEYESACPLPTPSGSMKGNYQLQTDDGFTFEIPIPEFFLIAPTAIH